MQQGRDAGSGQPAVSRSRLFVSAHVSRFAESAWRRGADTIILDLEDSVAPAAKEEARAAVREAIASVLRGGDSPVTVVLDGGELEVDVGEDLHVDLTGWAVPVFQGEVDVDQIASQSLGRAER